jgi:hypothetical protein
MFDSHYFGITCPYPFSLVCVCVLLVHASSFSYRHSGGSSLHAMFTPWHYLLTNHARSVEGHLFRGVLRTSQRQPDHIPIKPPDVPVPPVVDMGVLLLLHYPARSCLIVITLVSHAHIHFHSCVSVFCSCTRRPSRPSVVCVPTPPQLVIAASSLVTLNVV